MKARTFALITLAAVLLCFSVPAALLSVEDPFFVLGGIDEGETALFDNERYEMAGLIRHQDYSCVVVGTSLVANYRASWFTEGTGERTLKITFPDGWISEFDTALDLAFRTHPGLDTVYFCLDPNILIRSDSQRTVELPRYLYDLNPLNDVEYLLNAETYAQALYARLQRGQSRTVPLDEAYVWDRDHYFSKADALAGYTRPELSKTTLPADAYLEAAAENLDVLCSWVRAHPDTRFVFWFPPYSVLFWDMRTREGISEAVITAVEYASERLLACDGVEVCCFLDAEDVITDLDHYGDPIHCSSEITAWEADNLMEGGWRLTQENLAARMDWLRSFYASYDYDAIWDG